MLQESRIQEIALDSARASLAPIRVEAVTVAPMLDWMGQEALDVQVVVPESAVPKLRGKALIDFLMDLHDRLLAEGEQRHAFPHYATPEDLLAMPILNAEHLLDQAARLIVSPQPGPPRQVGIRRSISAAYYGLFHALQTAALWLQQQRHSADYDPIPRFRTADALTAIEQARTALSHFHTAPAKQRHALLWLLLFRPR